MAQIPDLWPDFVEVQQNTPLSILKTQAASLGKKTHDLLEGIATTESLGEDFRDWFTIYAPTLDYRLPVLRITHPLESYPLKASAWGGAEVTLQNEEEFLRWVGDVFSSDRMRKAIQSLLAQVKAAS